MYNEYILKTVSEKHWKKVVSFLFTKGFTYHKITDVNLAYDQFKMFPYIIIYFYNKSLGGSHIYRMEKPSITYEKLKEFFKKEKCYWKVVKKTTNGPGNRTFISVNGIVDLEYTLNKTTVPTIGKIFVFGSRKAARRFLIENNSHKVILKCKVTNPVKAMYRMSVNQENMSKLKKFWSMKHLTLSKSGDCDITYCPRNTYFVDSCTPIEISN